MPEFATGQFDEEVDLLLAKIAQNQRNLTDHNSSTAQLLC